MTSKASAAVAFVALALLTTYAEAPQGRGGVPQGGRGGGQRQAPSTTATASTDPKEVIETMQDNLGMLRGMQRNDSINRIEMWGTSGTRGVNGRSVTLSAWKVSLNFTMSGMRFDYTPQGGQRAIEVVSDKFAWNEDTPGGKATPMPAALQERQGQFVMTPIGVAEAAKGGRETAEVAGRHRGPNPNLSC